MLWFAVDFEIPDSQIFPPGLESSRLVTSKNLLMAEFPDLNNYQNLTNVLTKIHQNPFVNSEAFDKSFQQTERDENMKLCQIISAILG